ncbi:MAG: hypothetical protein AAF389_10335 [Gemmatimonadota bacterium]
MRRRLTFAALLVAFALVAANADAQVTAELDAFWSEVSRTVAEGDYDGYAATYHPDAVVIFGMASQPISAALAGWRQGFDDTKAGRMTAAVHFRFSERRNDATTAHETGIFRYVAGDGPPQYLHFEALLVKREGWLMLMEFQRDPATEAEWDALQ